VKERQTVFLKLSFSLRRNLVKFGIKTQDQFIKNWHDQRRRFRFERPQLAIGVQKLPVIARLNFTADRFGLRKSPLEFQTRNRIAPASYVVGRFDALLQSILGQEDGRFCA
jgi:hypothetical protein